MVRVNGLQCVRLPPAARMALVDVGHQFLGRHSATTDHHRKSLQLRILQQRHRGKEGIHVQMGDAS
jgi:hypothetical protein